MQAVSAAPGAGVLLPGSALGVRAAAQVLVSGLGPAAAPCREPGLCRLDIMWVDIGPSTALTSTRSTSTREPGGALLVLALLLMVAALPQRPRHVWYTAQRRYIVPGACIFGCVIWIY